MELIKYLNEIITVLQLVIGAGITVRCIDVIRKGREAEQSWSQIWQQLQKFIMIGAIAVTASEVVKVINSYYR